MLPGTSGNTVRSVQTLLKCLGYFPVDTDTTGYYGTVTRNAVTAFQTANGIDPFGFVGLRTRAAMNAHVK